MRIPDRATMLMLQTRQYFLQAQREENESFATPEAPQGGCMKQQNKRRKGGTDRYEPKIEAEELLVLHETTPDDRGRQQKIRVVRWHVDGAKQAPKLEKRGFYRGERDGAMLTGSPESLTLADVKLLASRLPEVVRTMEAGCF